MDNELQAWVEGIEDRRKAQRDAKLDQATYFATKIRALIKSKDRELDSQQDEVREQNRKGDPHATGVAGIHVRVIEGEIRGLRDALQIITGTRS